MLSTVKRLGGMSFWKGPLSGALALIFLAGCRKWNEPPRTDVVSGTIEVDETRVASRYGGRVESITAWEGDILKPGQIFIHLDAAELKARLAQMSAALDELKAGARKEELANASNEWESAEARVDFARAYAKRISESFQAHTVSAADRDRAVSEANSLEKNAAAAKSRYDLLVAGTRPERIAQAEAQVREVETDIKEMEIAAPTNAVLETLGVRVGDVLAPNQDMATLLLQNHLWVRVYVPETWLGYIKVGDTVPVSVDSFPNRTFNGQVEQVARAAEFTPRNVQTVGDRIKQVFGIKIRLPSDTGDLRAGMAADAKFPNVSPAVR
jgi:multidrug resistance efflux pump